MRAIMNKQIPKFGKRLSAVARAVKVYGDDAASLAFTNE
jgi:hypothetical protein